MCCVHSHHSCHPALNHLRALLPHVLIDGRIKAQRRYQTLGFVQDEMAFYGDATRNPTFLSDRGLPDVFRRRPSFRLVMPCTLTGARACHVILSCPIVRFDDRRQTANSNDTTRANEDAWVVLSLSSGKLCLNMQRVRVLQSGIAPSDFRSHY